MSMHSVIWALLLLVLAALFPLWTKTAEPEASTCDGFVGIQKPGLPRLLTCSLETLQAALGDCVLLEDLHQGDEAVLTEGELCFAAVRPLPADVRLQLGLPLDLNRATAEDLQQIDGLGPKTAQRLVEAQPFMSIDAILNVKGVGPSALRRWRPVLTLEPLPLVYPAQPFALTPQIP